ncbi:2-C-methyl-D-erythritol 4-phosphate cytidylyltransferase [Thioflexithrix psekupsensis]|uniref:2-C-methyl-D-erythritol 4-phosphate cytidylyltransferase n=1 Tax=Thioflexithrix psekupsensis TaxID=1570016 RepID=UPI001FDA58F8|nr:2-C-methyl-D-erythritol 4-phosphate cytidylyltransferase [Thioflexithrix psekupsensis]
MSNNLNYWAVVPAAGVGQRMGSACPKQYLSLLGKPILQHTLEKLLQTNVQGVVVSLAAEDNYWSQLPTLPRVWTAPGGTERSDSVRHALEKLLTFPEVKPNDWVLVHDAARPCVRVSDIQNLMQTVADYPIGGLLANPVRDTMKRADTQNCVTETVSRQQLWHALTPQMFRLQLLYDALTTAAIQGYPVTDESQAIELMGYSPVLVSSHPDNIKITHPDDLALAALFLQQQNNV